MSFEAPTKDTLAAILGRVPSGVFILTAKNDAGLETGMLASWVQQASFEPPMITVAINQKRYLHDWLKNEPHVVLNLLGEPQKQLLKHFGNGFGLGEPAFEGQEIERHVDGLPILKQALGYLVGKAVSQFDAGDHIVYLMQVMSGSHIHSLVNHKPMIHIRNSGSHY